MKSRTVLVLVRPASHVRMSAIARFARKRGWHLTFADRLSRLPVGWTGDGALVTVRGEGMVPFVAGLRRRHVPVVDLTIDHPEVKVPRVCADHRACGRLAAEHLLARHFTHAAWVSTTWSHSHALRAEGFTTAWHAATGNMPPRWILSESMGAREFDDWRLFTRHLGGLLLHAPKPLAVLAYDDADAQRVLAAAESVHLKVPEEVAIVGIGNDELVCENQTVPLTSVDHDIGRTGSVGAALLERIMSASDGPSKAIPDAVLIRPRGVVSRASTDMVAARNPLVRRALDYIRAHLADSFGSNEIARALTVSRTRLDRAFADDLRSSVQKETVRLRLDEVRRRLEDPQEPIAEIARQTGFSSPAYLSSVFRAATGLTPRDYRKSRANRK